MNLGLIDNLTFEYDTKDYPDFCDAMILTADYNGIPMTEEQLEDINDNHDFVHEKLFDFLF